MANVTSPFFRYASPGLLSGEEVARAIAKVEQTVSNFRDHTQLCSSQMVAKVSLPVTHTLPRGVVPVLGDNDIIIDYDPGIWSAPSLAPLIELSRFSHVSLLWNIGKYKHKFSCWLNLGKDGCSIQIEARDLKDIDKYRRLELVRKISGFLQLPVDFSQPALPVKTQEGLAIGVEGLEPSDVSAIMNCGLSQKACPEALEALLAETKGKLSCWRVKDIGVVPFPELVAKVNDAGLPSRKTEISHEWRLSSYKEFPVMAEMAARNHYQGELQSLLDFEFSGHKPGLLRVMADNKGRFKLFLDFKKEEDQTEFTRITGIKLKLKGRG